MAILDANPHMDAELESRGDSGSWAHRFSCPLPKDNDREGHMRHFGENGVFGFPDFECGMPLEYLCV